MSTCDDYCPNLAAAILFTVLFTLTTTLHTYQAWQYKKFFCWVLIMGGIWEVIGLASRVAEIRDPSLTNMSRTSFVFILLAPLWINAFVYMTLGRLVLVFMPDKKLCMIPARRLGIYFVLADVSCFFIQLVGGVMTLDQDDTAQVITGLHVYTAGTSLQEAFILLFVVLLIIFQRRLRGIFEERQDVTSARKLVNALFIVLFLITFRIAFRIIEFSAPLDSQVYSTINDNEAFIYVFDISLMFLALVVFNVYHPGKTLQGPESEFPSRVGLRLKNLGRKR